MWAFFHLELKCPIPCKYFKRICISLILYLTVRFADTTEMRDKAADQLESGNDCNMRILILIVK